MAEVILAEIGPDISRFPDAAHLASWAGMCPGNNESSGKHKQTGNTRKGSKWLRKALVESARATAGSKDTYLAARCARPHRVACVARRGSKKAAVVVGHSILGIASYLLSRDVVYKNLGGEFYVQLDAVTSRPTPTVSSTSSRSSASTWPSSKQPDRSGSAAGWPRGRRSRPALVLRLWAVYTSARLNG